MAITIREIVDAPNLHTRICAGAGGIDRVVTWAHSCEVPNPWEWLERGHLLMMTIGYGIPRDSQEQVHYIEQLDAVGVSGLLVGEYEGELPITPPMVTVADRLSFPILATSYEVPLTAIERAVADSSQRESQLRLSATTRMYDRLRQAVVTGREPHLLVDDIAGELGCALYVIDPRRGHTLIPGGTPPPATVRAQVLEEVAERGTRLPAVTRVGQAGLPTLVLPVSSRREAILVAELCPDSVAPVALLQHAATIVATQLEKLYGAREERTVLGADLLKRMLAGSIEAAAASELMAHHGLTGSDCVVVVFNADASPPHLGLHHLLYDRHVSHLLAIDGKLARLVIRSSEEDLAEVADILTSATPIGISDAVSGPSRLPDAEREARWALEASSSERLPLVHYGEGAPLFLPRTLTEASALVERVLGGLLNYQRENRTDFVASLYVFLQSNRSWQRASAALFVHKQTLVYRMRRVEELTGRRLNDTGDVAELWLALRALELLSPGDLRVTAEQVPA